MARVVEAPEERRQAIVETAGQRFRDVGNAKCSVDMTIRDMGVAKRTFYYYFKCEQDILEAFDDHTPGQIARTAQDIAAGPTLGALAKLDAPLSDSQIGDEGALEVAEMLRLPENRELHEITKVQTVLRSSPALAGIVEQGIDEGVIQTHRPLETIQFLFTDAQFLTDGGLFGFSEHEIKIHREVSQDIIKSDLRARLGSLGFMNPNAERHTKG